ncbi:MAG TPA: hypothetical protein VM695_08985 [Phycisphaerae bacterium]|nr:hypothetical protein [Phycisphaerae bacterium]
MPSLEHKVDSSARHSAATMLRLCLAGNLDISGAIDSWPWESEDRAVRLIGKALWDWPSAGVEEHRQLHDETRRSLRRCALFLDSDQQIDVPVRCHRRTAPFRDTKSLEAARARLKPGLPLDQVYCGADRRHRDRGAELLDEYLQQRMTVEKLRNAWPVPEEDLDRDFADDALRDIHRRLLTLLPAGTFPADEPLRPVVERCEAFLRTDQLWYARAWPRASPAVLAGAGLSVTLGVLFLVVVVTRLIAALSRGTTESDRFLVELSILAVVFAGTGACFILEHLSGKPLRRKIQRALLTGHLVDWPFPAKDPHSLARIEDEEADDEW